MSKLGLFLVILLVVICIIKPHECSKGDRFQNFQKCLSSCLHSNCSSPELSLKFHQSQRIFNKLLFWNCQDECRYDCMWESVEYLQSLDVEIPQFYGKWPFLRILGIQEPASVIASILNGIILYFAWAKFKSKVPSSAPMYRTIYSMGLVGMNAWFWSAIFHCRDTDFTEKMDYFCAFSLVFYSFLTVCIRFTKKPFQIPVIVSLLSVFAYHIHYLAFVRFDYGYNIKMNVTIGLLNSLGWLIWCGMNRKSTHMWKCFVSIICVGALILLELLDFPPIMWTFDAHSLWHFGTIPLPLLWYSFLTDDCLHLVKEKSGEMLPKTTNSSSDREKIE